MNFTDIIGIPVFSAYRCREEGYILGAFFSNNRILSQLLVADFETEAHKILQTKDIFSHGDAGIVIRNSGKIVLAESDSEPQSFIGKQVISVGGNSLGKIVEIEISPKWEVTKFVTDKTSFTPEQIVGHNTLVLINDRATEFKSHHFAPRKSNLVDAQAVQPVIALNSPIPARIPTTHAGLIGKKLLRDFLGQNNEILAHKNSVVSPMVVSRARQFNLLDELERCV